MMTPEQRAAFLEARKQGLGGSDCASLLQQDIEVKYGCARRLGLQKANVKPDFERTETGPMRLGNILEPVLCDEFSKLTGRRIEVVGRQTHADHPELGGHVDRMQHDLYRGEGIVEAKALGTRIFYETKRNGLCTDYNLQLQFYLAVVTRAGYGSFIVGNRDNLAVLYWDVDRNEALCEAIVRKGVEFWANRGDLDKLAPKLEPDDRRCASCEYSIQCHGSVLLPSSDKDDIPVAPELEPLAKEYIERKQMADEAEELVAETKEIVMTILGDRQAVQVSVDGKLRPLYWRPQEGKPLYAQAVKDMGAQYAQMRDALVQIQRVVTNPSLRDLADGTLQRLVAGAELIPPPSSYIRKGKPSRPLLMQFLSPAKKDDE